MSTPQLFLSDPVSVYIVASFSSCVETVSRFLLLVVRRVIFISIALVAAGVTALPAGMTTVVKRESWLLLIVPIILFLLASPFCLPFFS